MKNAILSYAYSSYSTPLLPTYVSMNLLFTFSHGNHSVSYTCDTDLRTSIVTCMHAYEYSGAQLILG